MHRHLASLSDSVSAFGLMHFPTHLARSGLCNSRFRTFRVRMWSSPLPVNTRFLRQSPANKERYYRPDLTTVLTG